MPRSFRLLLALACVGLAAGPAAAHFHMLLPEAASARRGQPVTFVYQWGHPFEHQLFDAPAPERVWCARPAGPPTDLTRDLEKAAGAGVARYRFRFTPRERGDFLFFLQTPPVWMEEDQEFLQDTVKVVLHVQAQQGWDAAGGAPLELVPLTRPYGLRPGTVFQAVARGQAGAKPAPLAGALIEVERYNPAPPKALPPDEFITRTVKTDANGVATCTLPEPGWWCLTVARPAGHRPHAGKDYPVRQRAALWIYVDPPP